MDKPHRTSSGSSGHFIVRSAASLQVNDYNDDAFGAGSTRLWVLDGATGVSDSKLTRSASDASWLAHTTASLLESPQWDAVPTKDLLAGLEQSVQHAFSQEIREADAPSASTDEMPSCCLGLVQLLPDRLEVACVGDISVVVEQPGRQLQVFTDDAAAQFSQRTLAAWRRARATEREAVHRPGHILEAVRPVILENRKAMNRPGGYRVIHPTLRWAEGVTIHCIERRPNTRVLLASDGLWRLVDLFADVTPQGLWDRVAEFGVSAAIDRVRALEAADANCDQFHRVKASDDATGLMAHLSLTEGRAS